MTDATLKQVMQVLSLMSGKHASRERVQALLDAGLLADLLEADPRRVDRVRFREALSGASASVPASAASIWKTITLGLHKSQKAYRKALEKAGFRIGDYAGDILGKTPVSSEERQVRLVVRSVANLGFTEATRYEVICARAKELGLDLCPAEVGPALRLAYMDQLAGEWILVAMEAMTARDRGLSVFNLARDEGGRWLVALYGGPGLCWNPGNRFVFVSREL